MFVRNGQALGSVQHTEPSARPKIKAREPEPATEVVTNPEAEEPQEAQGVETPPRAGAGSGAEHWQEFLTDNGIEFPADAGRNDLIDIWDNREGGKE